MVCHSCKTAAVAAESCVEKQGLLDNMTAYPPQKKPDRDLNPTFSRADFPVTTIHKKTAKTHDPGAPSTQGVNVYYFWSGPGSHFKCPLTPPSFISSFDETRATCCRGPGKIMVGLSSRTGPHRQSLLSYLLLTPSFVAGLSVAER